MKYIINIILKTIFFIFLFLLFYLYISKIFMHKENWRGDLGAIKSFYKQKKNTLDVVFLGTSHVYTGISNWQLWDEHGITSYNFSNSSQPLQMTYFMLEEVIRVQKPKLIVVDLFGLVLPLNEASVGLNHANLDYMPLSKTKVKAINSLIKDRKNEFICPMIKYHSRWNNLNKKDFQTLKHIGLGSDLLFETKKNSSFEIIRNDIEDKNINLEYLSILDKMIALCQNEKIDLLFTTLPYHAPSKPNGIKITHIEQQKIFNNVNKLFSEKKIRYLNFFHLLDEISFNWDTDMNDSSHLNINGAYKITSFLGKYIKTNYHIYDKRNDSHYINWWKEYELYKHDILKKELNRTKDYHTYINILSQNMDKYLIIISGKDTLVKENIYSNNELQIIKKLNLNKDFSIKFRESYVAIINQKNILFEKKSKETLKYELKIDNLPISITSSNWEKENFASIKIDGIEKRTNKRGLGIVVYDKILKDTIDSVVFDTYDNGKCYR